MSTERRKADRRVSQSVTEYAALECERLRAELDLLTEGYPGIAHDFEATIQDNERLRAVNAELVAALQRIATLPSKSSLHTDSDLAVQIARAVLARAEGKA